MHLDATPCGYLEEIAALLSQRVGFDAKIIGSRKISRAVENRLIACRLSTQAYLQLLQSSPQEFNELIEQLVVPETWFFRDRKPFDFLMNFVQSQWLPKSGGAKLRVLSVPCSTGEEPYSIAIALLEAGLPAHRFSIDAIDISQQAIAKAQRATYGKNSFRGEDWVERHRYFQAADGKYIVYPLVRNLVNFRHGNLLSGFASTHLKYDIIFCRNLLIYLEDTACQQVLNALHQLLTPKGLLFVGASETGKVLSDRFFYIRQPFTFAYQKISSTSNQSLKVNLEQANSQLSFNKSLNQTPKYSEAKTTIGVRRNTQIATAKTKTADAAAKTFNMDLQQARQLADIGQIEAAIDCCKVYLESHFTNAEAHALLGTLYQATANHEQAERCFQKALYLQPNFYEALMHLVLLKESRGDKIAVKRLWQRILKLQPTS